MTLRGVDGNPKTLRRITRALQQQAKRDAAVGGYGNANHVHVWNETPTGDIDGSNADFTLANTPATGSLLLFVNGMLMRSGGGNDFTISGKVVTFNSGAVPETGDWLLASYVKG